MVRHLSFVAVFVVSSLLFAGGGCRSCSSCHDYDSPVPGCNCGCGRLGSNFSGCNGGCSTDGGSTCENGACGCESQGGGYYDESAGETELVPQ